MEATLRRCATVPVSAPADNVLLLYAAMQHAAAVAAAARSEASARVEQTHNLATRDLRSSDSASRFMISTIFARIFLICAVLALPGMIILKWVAPWGPDPKPLG